MDFKAYPFLITSNGTIGYQSVVMPLFAGKDYLKYAIPDREPKTLNQAFVRLITDPTKRNSSVTCVFQAVKPTKKDAGIPEDGRLFIKGRGFFLIYGIAFY